MTHDEPLPTSSRHDLVTKQIFETAITLIAERGFAGTSLQDIADAAGLTRSALYYYIKSKDDLLARLVGQETDDIADRLSEIANAPASSSLVTLRELVREAALRQLAAPDHFRLLVRSEAELPSELAQTYRNGRRRVLKAFQETIEEGVNRNEIRSVDARTAALGVIGMVNWVAWWHRPGQIAVDEAIAAQFAEFAVAGLAHVDDRASGLVGPAQALALLRHDVELLERLIIE
ncbi:TetR/AcrR family transcriptional regulator [Subtercola lobariae]|uniref:TetR family transcriptional regulator n=1 Tax=Subtercola lobariae TaxID=1588641 RepID=A0A917EZ26_9MICO|nr:TetR family transcriptional regulator [Subtercola lobariae]GGF33950.1 TetR family transcriptional regulator [Subtercola lobariae]